MNRLVEFHNTLEAKRIEYYNKSRQIYFNYNKYNHKKDNKNGTTNYVCASPGCSVSFTLGPNNEMYRLPDEKKHKEHYPETCLEIDIEIKLARLIDLVIQDSLGYSQIEPKYDQIYKDLVVK